VALLGANYGETIQNETIQNNETATEHRQLIGAPQPLVIRRYNGGVSARAEMFFRRVKQRRRG